MIRFDLYSEPRFSRHMPDMHLSSAQNPCRHELMLICFFGYIHDSTSKTSTESLWFMMRPKGNLTNNGFWNEHMRNPFCRRSVFGLNWRKIIVTFWCKGFLDTSAWKACDAKLQVEIKLSWIDGTLPIWSYGISHQGNWQELKPNRWPTSQLSVPNQWIAPSLRWVKV